MPGRAVPDGIDGEPFGSKPLILPELVGIVEHILDLEPFTRQPRALEAQGIAGAREGRIAAAPLYDASERRISQ